MTPGFTVWVTGADARAVRGVLDELTRRLDGRHVQTEVLDDRTPDIELLGGDEVVERLAFVARLLARHGVATLIRLPADSRAARRVARGAIERMIVVHVVVRGAPDPAGYEPPEQPEVELTVPEETHGSGADRVLKTLELLSFLPRDEDRAYSAEEEREVIRRLKSFGYL